MATVLIEDNLHQRRLLAQCHKIWKEFSDIRTLHGEEVLRLQTAHDVHINEVLFFAGLPSVCGDEPRSPSTVAFPGFFFSDFSNASPVLELLRFQTARCQWRRRRALPTTAAFLDRLPNLKWVRLRVLRGLKFKCVPPDLSHFLDGGSTVDRAFTVFPSFTKPRPQEEPTVAQAGLGRSSGLSVTRWKSNSFRFRPHQYVQQSLVFDGHLWRPPVVAERARLLGHATGYTADFVEKPNRSLAFLRETHVAICCAGQLPHVIICNVAF